MYSHERQPRLHGHVARCPRADRARFSIRENPEWRRPRGRPQSSWNEQVNGSCYEVFGMGEGPAGRDAWRKPEFSIVGWARRRAPERMPPLIDCLCLVHLCTALLQSIVWISRPERHQGRRCSTLFTQPCKAFVSTLPASQPSRRPKTEPVY